MSSVHSRILLLSTLALPALSCLHIEASGSSGLIGSMRINATDNDVQTCTVDYTGIYTDSGSASCIDGFQMSWNWPHIDGPLDIHYCNPATCFDFEIEQNCTNEGNCCGSTCAFHCATVKQQSTLTNIIDPNAPCICYVCKWGLTTYC